MEKQMKTAAIYARVSSDKQKEENTIASQTAALTEFARKEGYDVPREWIFEDEGFSGASLLRPGLERLRDLAAEGQLEAILVYAPDRISRKYAYQILSSKSSRATALKRYSSRRRRVIPRRTNCCCSFRA
jgi:site-specific DNA recombinase